MSSKYSNLILVDHGNKLLALEYQFINLLFDMKKTYPAQTGLSELYPDFSSIQYFSSLGEIWLFFTYS